MNTSSLHRIAAAVAAGALATGLVTVLDGGTDRTGRPAAAAATLTRVSAVPADAPGSIAQLRARVERLPGDWPAWSNIGALELERGRATGDPAAYAAAAAAFDTSLRVQPTGNDAALAGQAALAAARHDFAAAERTARAALTVNPSSAAALAVLTDALTELGRYPAALDAATRLDAQRPGIASFTRLSYQAELRGRLPEAVELMSRAAGEAATAEQIAFARANEGQLRLATGDLAGATAAWRAGSEAAADDAGLAALGARLAWARGDREDAVRRYAELARRRPTPANAAAHAEVLTALRRAREAATALDVARAGQALARQAGIAPEPADVLFEADHGRPARAVQLAEMLWRAAPSVSSADAYGWALHVAGRHREALGYADRALALGGRPAAFLAHRGTIRAALGDRAGAAADLRDALRIDPTFSPLHAPLAAELLARVEVSS